MTRPGRESRYLPLVKSDARFRLWFESFQSRKTARNYARMLTMFCDRVGLTPSGYVALPGEERDDLLQSYLNAHVDWASVSVRKAVVSWLGANRLALGRKIAAKEPEDMPRKDNSYIPPVEELARVLEAADVRAKVAITIVALAGQRIEVLGSEDSEGNKVGLTLGMFPEVVIRADGTGIEFPRYPTEINVPKKLSKIGKPYIAFLGKQGCEYLAQYMAARVQPRERTAGRRGERRSRFNSVEKLTPDTPILAPVQGEPTFISATNVSDIIRKPMKAAGVKLEPNIWRSYFQTNAERCRELIKDWRAFIVGHKGDMSAVYALHRTLPADKVEDLRAAYEKASTFVETTGRGPAAKAMNRLAELEGRMAEIVAAKPVVRSMDDLRERGAISAELARAQTDAMSPGELNARTEAQDLAERVEELEARLEAAIQSGAEEGAMTRAEVIELVKLGVLTKDEARNKLGLVVAWEA